MGLCSGKYSVLLKNKVLQVYEDIWEMKTPQR